MVDRVGDVEADRLAFAQARGCKTALGGDDAMRELPVRDHVALGDDRQLLGRQFRLEKDDIEAVHSFNRRGVRTAVCGRPRLLGPIVIT